jgi:twitching motility protein PilT
VGTPALRNLIRENKVAQMYSAMQTGQRYGMMTMDQVLEKLVKDKLVTKENAREHAVNKEKFA